MTGTGNDIVSLNAVNNFRAKNPRYYSKILSTSEIVLYYQSGFKHLSFENFVWLLWTIKESGYKFLQRINTDLIFSPTKFIVQQLQIPIGYTAESFDVTEIEGRGFDGKSNVVFNSTIKIGDETLFSRSIIHKELIMSIVNVDNNFENVYWGIKLINKSDSHHQSMEVRKFLVSRLQRAFQMDNLFISKSKHGIPFVQTGSKEMAISVSLSHHDHWVAYSFSSERKAVIM